MSSYENAAIIHDMNNPLNETLKSKKYDYVLDGGTIEHIYNIPQVCENIIDLLKIDGIFCSVNVNNNFSGHGFYQFSPDFFMATFSKKYGMKIISVHLAQINTPFNEWVNMLEPGVHGETRFLSQSPVYIVTIAQKISDERQHLTSSCPQQDKYENYYWNTTQS